MTGAPQPGLPVLSFNSAQEFEALCQALATKLHAKNRIAMGESGFVWELAELIRRCGPALKRGLDDPAVAAAFGDGYTEGSLSREEGPAALFALLYPPAMPG